MVSLNTTVEKIGRPIRLAVVGGGASVIGGTHRTAIRFDGHFELVAGVVSSDPAKSKALGAELGLSRIYSCFEDMLRDERLRSDPVDAIAIMTPNDTHFPYTYAALDAGFHVICDKPLANNSQDACQLRDKAESLGLVLCVTYNYSGYPMVRQAREMIAAGTIGRAHLVEVRSVQGNLGAWVENSQGQLPKHIAWRLDPDRGGRQHLLLDVGTHAHHLARYVLSRDFTDVYADVGPAILNRTFDDSAVILGRMSGDLRTSLIVTKAATGAPHVLSIQVYGDKGGIVWEQSQPNIVQHLTEGRANIFYRNAGSLAPLALRSIRLPYPHPEGFREAFANIYADFAELVASRIAKVSPDPLALSVPTGRDGAAGLLFVEACYESKERHSWVALEENNPRPPSNS